MNNLVPRNRPVSVLAFFTAALLLFHSAGGHDENPVERAGFQSGVESLQKPWTNLSFRNDPDNFQFAIISDRTGSPRDGIFQEAVKKLNWLQPEFVMSVGDLIQGTSKNGVTNAAEWEEFIGWVEPLEMPFFFLAGNHDIQAKWVENRVPYDVMREQWEDRFGTTYYYYVYKDVLFMALFSNDGIERHISEEQVAYFKEVLKAHQEARWTMVFLHHPLWDSPHDSNFHEIESMLEGRDYSVFAGHQHLYRHFERKNRNYYVLATTGGGSSLRGTEFGEFDHVTWVTMTDDGPVLANIRLDGILPHDVTDSVIKRYSLDLTRSASFDTSVILEEGELVSGGVAYLTFRNRSSFPIRYRGKFYHNHYVHPSLGKIDLLLDPRSEETLSVELEVLEPFTSDEGVQLEMMGSVEFAGEDLPAMKMSGSQSIELVPSKIEIFGSESLVFCDTTHLELDFGTGIGEIRYTLDGSEPTSESLLFKAPMAIESNVVLNARIYSRNGMGSPTDTIKMTKILPGPGLLCEVYEYGDNPALKYGLPDFSLMTPTMTKVVAGLDPEKAARRDESFGLVFKGYIELPEEGEYQFHLESDDGARLLIDGNLVVDDPMKHPVREVSGKIVLKKGRLPFEVQHFQHKQRMRIGLAYTLPSGKRLAVPESSYSFGGADRAVAE